MHLGTTLLNGKTFRPRAVRDGDHAEKLATHAAMPGLVEIDTEHRQDAGEVDSHVIDAGWDQSRVVLPCLARREFLPCLLSELSRVWPMMPMNRRYRCAALGRVAMSLSETGAVSTGPTERSISPTRAWNRRRMPTPRIRDLKAIRQPRVGGRSAPSTSPPRLVYSCNVPIDSAPIASVWAGAVQTAPGDGPGHEAHGKEAEEDVLHVHVDVPRV
jgi:hypothetical protein